MSEAQQPQSVGKVDFTSVDFHNAHDYSRDISAESIMSTHDSLLTVQGRARAQKLRGYIDAVKPSNRDIAFASSEELQQTHKQQIDEFVAKNTPALTAAEALDPVAHNSAIQIVEEPFGRSVVWDSEGYRQRKRDKIRVYLTRALFLNPTYSETPQFFEQLTEQISASGLQLIVRGRLLDRSSAGGTHGSGSHRRLASIHSRGDGIVLLTQNYDATQVLRIAKELYGQHTDAFRGQAVARVPMKIADGFAIGDQPEGAGVDKFDALTAHRTEALLATLDTLEVVDMSKRSYRGRNIRRDRLKRAFDASWSEEAPARGIDPHNLALNVSTKAYSPTGIRPR